MENQTKYEATLTVKHLSDFKYIGKVKANSIKELKEQAKEQARSWDNYGRVYVSEENKGLEFVIIA